MADIGSNRNSIFGYGLELTPLTYEKLEMVRQWRNAPEVQNYMIFREHITKEMQQNWFKSISNEQNYYYIIRSNENDIGYVHIKNVKDGSGELGSLIFNVKDRGRGFGTLSNWLMICHAFECLKLEKLIIHVLDKNECSFRMYKSLGFQPVNTDNTENGIILCHLDCSLFKSIKKYVEQMITQKL